MTTTLASTNGHHATADPRKITNIEEEAMYLLDRIAELEVEERDAIIRDIFGIHIKRYASDIRQQINALKDQLDPIMAEIRRRRI